MKRLKIPRYIQWIGLTGIIFLLLMSLLRLALVLTFKIPSAHSTPFTSVFLLGLRYDLRMVSIACLLLFLIGSIPVLHPLEKKWGKKISFWIWGLLIALFVVFYTIDFANYAYLSQRITGSVINYLDDATISMRMVWQTYHVGWILLCLFILFVALFALIKIAYNFVLSGPKEVSPNIRVTWAIVFFLLLSLGIFGRMGQYPLRWSDAFAFGDDYAANISLNPFQSFFSSFSFRHSSYDAKKLKEAYPLVAQYLGVNHPDSTTLNYDRTSTANTPTSTLNVVIIICESFSAYKSSMYGNPLNTTPYFNQLCKEGVFFNRCFTPSYGTARGVWAVVTGIPDVELQTTASRNPHAVDQHTIINDFKGYEKYYFIGGSTSWANIRGLLENNIQQLHLYEQDQYDAPKVDVWGISDKNLFLEANKILSSQKKPFIAVIQTADNHRPYTIPKEDQSEFKLKDVPKDSLQKYGFENVEEYNAFRYTDFGYQKFMEAAKASPYFNNTIFVFVGDHGIRGDAGKMFPKAWTEQLTSEHVPLLFYAPSLLQPKEISTYSSQVDVLPTIAGICGIPYTNTALGRNLLSLDSTKTFASFIYDYDRKKIGVVQDGYYYTYGLNNSSPEQLFSITNNQLPLAKDSIKQQLRKTTDAFYETSRYLLLNNKKRLK